MKMALKKSWLDLALPKEKGMCQLKSNSVSINQK